MTSAFVAQHETNLQAPPENGIAAFRNGRIRRRRSRYSPVHTTEAEQYAWRDGQAAGYRDRPRDIPDHAVAARRHDRRGADLALYAGAGVAGAGDHLRSRHFDRADDGVALH